MLGFQGSVIKMLIVGFDFFCFYCVQFVCRSGYQGLCFLCVRSKMQVIQQDLIFTSGLAR